MCTIIDADYLLATVLSTTEAVSFQLLSKLRSRIESEMPDVVVDLSSPTFDLALEYYPEIFKRRGNHLVRAANADQYLLSGYFDCEFASSVPADVHEKVKQAIKALLPQAVAR